MLGRVDSSAGSGGADDRLDHAAGQPATRPRSVNAAASGRNHRSAHTFRRGKIRMMSSRRDRVLHLQVETEEMYGVFSPDRSRLLTAGDGANPKVHIWDAETGNCLRAVNGHKEPAAHIASAR